MATWALNFPFPTLSWYAPRVSEVNSVNSDEALMRRYVEDNDSTAFHTLFERYSPRLFGMAMRHLRRKDLAQDLVQRTFLHFHRARADFRFDSRVAPWITTIAMNLIREYWRRNNGRKYFEFDADRHGKASGTVDTVEACEDQQALFAALDKLNENERAVVELRWYQEMSFREVADTLGSSEGAVRVKAHRALRKLQTLMKEEC